MKLFEWNNSYSVGVDKIDEQHQKLVELLNELFDAMKIGKGYDVLDHILTSLIDYTKEHFTEEEKIMIENGYPEKEMHFAEHKRLVDEVVKFQSDFKNKKRSVSLDVMNFLKNWLQDHIKGTDKKLGNFIVQTK